MIAALVSIWRIVAIVVGLALVAVVAYQVASGRLIRRIRSGRLR